MSECEAGTSHDAFHCAIIAGLLRFATMRHFIPATVFPLAMHYALTLADFILYAATRLLCYRIQNLSLNISLVYFIFYGIMMLHCAAKCRREREEERNIDN